MCPPIQKEHRLNRFQLTRRATAMAVSVMVVLIAGACGSSTHSSTATTTQTTTLGSAQTTTQGSAQTTTQGCNQSGGRGVTASTINVAGLVTVLDFGTGAGKAAAARFAQASSDGEIPCDRKINYITTLDDQGTPDGNLAAIRQLVQQDHVFGIAPALSPFIQSGGVYINQQQVPTVGWGVAPAFCPTSNFSSTYAFAFNGCLVPAPPTYEANVGGKGLKRCSRTWAKVGRRARQRRLSVTTTRRRGRGTLLLPPT